MTTRKSPIIIGDYDNDKAVLKMWKAICRQMDKDTRQDVVRHGMASGFGQLIYYHDTVKFYRKHEDAIFALIANEADQTGHDNIFAYLAECNMADSATDPITARNLMVWVAVEILCQAEQYNSEN